VRTVEISGYSHFFGFEALIRPHRDFCQVYEYLGNRPKRHVGMPIAKTAQGRGLFLAARFGILRCCQQKGVIAQEGAASLSSSRKESRK
jgi:hypothetical protein